MWDLQLASQNITEEIDTTGIIIHWKMRNWKSLLAICLALDIRRVKRIYSNISIYHKWALISKPITSISQLMNIRFSKQPWLVIIDEAGINANSKDTRSKWNRDLQELLFLIWKKNCSLIWIAQRFESIDVNARVLADYIFECRKIKRFNKAPIFKITRQKQKWRNLQFLTQYNYNMIDYIESKGISYNTLEESKFTSEDKEKLTGEELGHKLAKEIKQYEKKYKVKLITD